MIPSPVTPIDRKLMREMNQNTLLNLIRTHAPISRTQLVGLSGLSVGTVVGITSELIKNQLVIEQGVAESAIGRKAGLLELHPEGGYVIGLSFMEEETIAAILLNLLGDIVVSDSWKIQLRNHSELVIQTITQGIEAFLAKSNIPRSKILGLGCGLPGYVNAQTGDSVDNWIHNWHDLSIRAPLADALKFPVFIDNIVNCLGSYEKLFGHGRQYRNFLVVTLGRGVGLAMVINDDIYRGALGGGGEFGHIPVAFDGRRCECGNFGCLEAYVADPGLLASYRAYCQAHPNDLLPPPGLTLAELQEATRKSHPELRTIFTHAGRLLGMGLATLVNLFNPECIIITGVDVYPENLIFDSMHQALEQHIFSRLGERLSLVIEPVTDNRWAQGAGSLALHHFFLSPIQV